MVKPEEVWRITRKKDSETPTKKLLTTETSDMDDSHSPVPNTQAPAPMPLTGGAGAADTTAASRRTSAAPAVVAAGPRRVTRKGAGLLAVGGNAPVSASTAAPWAPERTVGTADQQKAGGKKHLSPPQKPNKRTCIAHVTDAPHDRIGSSLIRFMLEPNALPAAVSGGAAAIMDSAERQRHGLPRQTGKGRCRSAGTALERRLSYPFLGESSSHHHTPGANDDDGGKQSSGSGGGIRIVSKSATPAPRAGGAAAAAAAGGRLFIAAIPSAESGPPSRRGEEKGGAPTGRGAATSNPNTPRRLGSCLWDIITGHGDPANDSFSSQPRQPRLWLKSGAASTGSLTPSSTAQMADAKKVPANNTSVAGGPGTLNRTYDSMRVMNRLRMDPAPAPSATTDAVETIVLEPDANVRIRKTAPFGHSSAPPLPTSTVLARALQASAAAGAGKGRRPGSGGASNEPSPLPVSRGTGRHINPALRSVPTDAPFDLATNQQRDVLEPRFQQIHKASASARGPDRGALHQRLYTPKTGMAMCELLGGGPLVASLQTAPTSSRCRSEGRKHFSELPTSARSSSAVADALRW